MPFLKTNIMEYVVESEEDAFTLRIYNNKNKRIASCHLVATGIESVRLKNFATHESSDPRSALRAVTYWLHRRGYKLMTYERMKSNGELVEREQNIEKLIARDSDKST